MCHGDDRGLRVPPRLAPIQVVVVLVKADGDAGTAAAAAGRPSCEGRRAGRARRAGRHELRPPRGRLGAEGRAGPPRGRPPRPRRGRGDARAPRHRHEGDRAAAAPPPGEARPCSRASRTRCSPPPRPSGTRASATSPRSRRPPRRRRRLGADAVVRAPGRDGEARLREQGITVRCLAAPTAPCRGRGRAGHRRLPGPGLLTRGRRARGPSTSERRPSPRGPVRPAGRRPRGEASERGDAA